MKVMNKKKLSEIEEEKKEEVEKKLAEVYEVLINLDDRLSKIEELLKLKGGK